MVQQNVTSEALQLLESDCTLGPKVLQLFQQGFFSRSEGNEDIERIDPESPFHRGETHHNRLTMKKLAWLFRQLGLADETVDAICTKSKLLSARWLWCWFVDAEMSDKLPSNTLAGLSAWAQTRFKSQKFVACKWG